MIIFRKTIDLTNYIATQRKNGRSSGFVPTMGALHKGHISLIEQSREEQAITVSSIFVNPTQFNNAADFAKYPITLETDIDQLEAAGCDVLFLPSVEEIYPNGTNPSMHYDLGFLETVLEGKYRPGHFQGVCQVVHRLLEIIMPDTLYLGQKDYQQCMVLRKMIELVGWQDLIHLGIGKTVRETDGLAMSSRNMRLNSEERKKAVLISATLLAIKKNIRPGNLLSLKKNAVSLLTDAGFKVDYVEICTDDLQAVDTWDGKTRLVVLCAAFLNEVRLIDNMTIIGR